MKKYFAEMVGTMVLVLMGCGVAVALGCDSTVGANTASVIGTSLAFGLAVVAMAYTVGGISGCHINPAITLGCLLTKRISAKDAAMYMLFQVIGAFVGAGILAALVGCDSGLGANALQEGNGITVCQGLLAEVVFTFVFVLVVLGTTDEKKGAGNFAGLAIGLSLVLVHLACIYFTGTSVNPARSIAPAVLAGGAALNQLWIFIVGPFAGGALAALVWKFLACDCCCCKKD
ncbi:MAG: MIP family channel protein [Paludibacteraceae bacterium]|jgi:aquaporin Z|nr:MIP family channel protein [Paludibacteraceae bacterium]MDD6357988.1 MIP family channel protein [Bacteroidales bacterium]